MLKLVWIITVFFLLPFSSDARGTPESEKTFKQAVEQYHNESYREAAASFRKSGALNPGDQAINLYNLGNALVKQSELIVSENPEAAVSLLDESIAAYKRAIEINSELYKASYNMEVAKRLLAKLSRQENQRDGPRQTRENNRENKEEQEQKQEQDESKKIIDEILADERNEQDPMKQAEGGETRKSGGRNW